MRLSNENAVFMDVNTMGPFGKKTITCLAAIHAETGRIFRRTVTEKSPIKFVLYKFFYWLSRLNNGKPIALISHNAFGFDVRILAEIARLNRVRIPKKIVKGFYDSMIAYRSVFRLKGNPSLDSLAGYSEPRSDHGALKDARLLKRVTFRVLRENNMTIDQLFGPESFREN